MTHLYYCDKRLSSRIGLGLTRLRHVRPNFCKLFGSDSGAQPGLVWGTARPPGLPDSQKGFVGVQAIKLSDFVATSQPSIAWRWFQDKTLDSAQQRRFFDSVLQPSCSPNGCFYKLGALVLGISQRPASPSSTRPALAHADVGHQWTSSPQEKITSDMEFMSPTKVL